MAASNQLTAERPEGNSLLTAERPAGILSDNQIKEYSDKYAWFKRAANSGLALYLGENGDPSSVLTSTFTDDNNQIYLGPTIIQKTDSQGNRLKGLRQIEGKAAHTYAVRHGIPVPSVKEGDELSKKISKTMGWLSKIRKEKRLEANTSD